MALRRTGERRGTPSRWLIVGLANPGGAFDNSRHNVGGDAVRLLAERRGATLSLERRLRSLTATLPGPEGPVLLAVPVTYMNESGAAVAPLVARARLEDLSRLVVVHDELDLEPGRRQLKVGGGLAGHNGLRSIASALGSQEFTRLRIGVGKPRTKEQGADHVLQRLRGARLEALRNDVAAAADALELLIDEGVEAAQQWANRS